MKGALSALSLLTIVPIPPALAGDNLRRASVFFGAVGLLLGGLSRALAEAHPRLGGPLTAGLIILLLALASGGLHLDGVADVCDGLGGGRGDPARTRAIMRDPRVGAHGAAGLCLVLLLKAAALSRCLTLEALPALWLAPACARAVIVPLLLFPARAGGLGASVCPAQPGLSLTANGLVVGAGLGWLGAQLWPAVLAAALVAGGLGRWALRNAGGISGDVLGATIETAEVAFLVTVAALAG